MQIQLVVLAAVASTASGFLHAASCQAYKIEIENLSTQPLGPVVAYFGDPDAEHALDYQGEPAALTGDKLLAFQSFTNGIISADVDPMTWDEILETSSNQDGDVCGYYTTGAVDTSADLLAEITRVREDLMLPQDGPSSWKFETTITPENKDGCSCDNMALTVFASAGYTTDGVAYARIPLVTGETETYDMVLIDTGLKDNFGENAVTGNSLWGCPNFSDLAPLTPNDPPGHVRLHPQTSGFAECVVRGGTEFVRLNHNEKVVARVTISPATDSDSSTSSFLFWLLGTHGF